MLEIIALLIAGFVLLYAGSEGLVRGSSSLAISLGISPLLVGLTVVAFGTSSPELVVSVKTSISGQGDISLGNVIGSNISNIMLILGVTALIRPISISSRVIKVEIPITIGVSALLFLLLLNNSLSRFEGTLLFIGFIIFTIFSYYTSRKGGDVDAEHEYERKYKSPKKTSFNIFLTVTGLAGLIIGSNLFVDGAIKLAVIFGLSEAVIGLTVVAIGTSLPELATAIVASIKGEGDIAIGNVIGSNIFNVLGILAVAAIINPINSAGINMTDLLVMIVSCVALFPLAFTGRKIDRWEGGLLVVGYIIYIGNLL